MLAKKFLGAASVVALLAAPISTLADEAGGAIGDVSGWMGEASAVDGVTKGALAGVAVAGGVALGFVASEIADDDDSSSSATTTTTTTTTN